MRMGRKAVVLGIAGLLLAGCSRVDRAADAARAAVLQRQAEAQAGIDELNALQGRSTGLTYTATYTVTTSDGETDQIVIAQKPPRSLYRKGDTRLVDDGTRLLSCTTGECLDSGPHDAAATVPGALRARGAVELLSRHFGVGFNPLGFVGTYALTFNPNVGLTLSTRDTAGQASRCFKLDPAASPTSYTGCLSERGVFTYSDDGTGTVVELVQLEEQVDEASFVAPAPVVEETVPTTAAEPAGGPAGGPATTPTT